VSLELVVSVMGDNGHILCCSRNDGSLVQYPGVVPAEQRRYSLYCPAIHGVFFGGRYWDADFEEGTSNMSQKQKKKYPVSGKASNEISGSFFLLRPSLPSKSHHHKNPTYQLLQIRWTE
jgi:hypothetical protein